MWGQEVAEKISVKSAGIIPTRVGTSYVQPTAANVSAGSSPRVWGQVSPNIPARNIKRIIPTRVGTRVYHTLPYNYAWDHPHACGDKYLKLYMRIWSIRIIPTRVGTRRHLH